MNNLTATFQSAPDSTTRVTRIKNYTVQDRGTPSTSGSASHFSMTHNGFTFNDDSSKLLETRKASNVSERVWQYSATVSSSVGQVDPVLEALKQPSAVNLYAMDKKSQAHTSGSLSNVLKSNQVISKIPPDAFSKTTSNIKGDPQAASGGVSLFNGSKSVSYNTAARPQPGPVSGDKPIMKSIELNLKSNLLNSPQQNRPTLGSEPGFQVRVVSRSREKMGNFESLRLSQMDETRNKPPTPSDARPSYDVYSHASVNNYLMDPTDKRKEIVSTSLVLDSKDTRLLRSPTSEAHSFTSPKLGTPSVLSTPQIETPKITPSLIVPSKFHTPVVLSTPVNTSPKPQHNLVPISPQTTPLRSMRDFLKASTAGDSNLTTPQNEFAAPKQSVTNQIQPLILNGSDRFNRVAVSGQTSPTFVSSSSRINEVSGSKTSFNFYEPLKPTVVQSDLQAKTPQFSQTAANWRNGVTAQSEYMSTRPPQQVKIAQWLPQTLLPTPPPSASKKEVVVQPAPSLKNGEKAILLESSLSKTQPIKTTYANGTTSTLASSVTSLSSLPPQDPKLLGAIVKSAPVKEMTSIMEMSPTQHVPERPNLPIERTSLRQGEVRRYANDRDTSEPRIVQSMLLDGTKVSGGLSFRKQAQPISMGAFKIYSSQALENPSNLEKVAANLPKVAIPPPPSLSYLDDLSNIPRIERDTSNVLSNAPTPKFGVSVSEIPNRNTSTLQNDPKNGNKKPILKKNGSRSRCESVFSKNVKINENLNEKHEFERYNFTVGRPVRQGSYFEQKQREEEERLRAGIRQAKDEQAKKSELNR